MGTKQSKYIIPVFEKEVNTLPVFGSRGFPVKYVILFFHHAKVLNKILFTSPRIQNSILLLDTL